MPMLGAQKSKERQHSDSITKWQEWRAGSRERGDCIFRLVTHRTSHGIPKYFMMALRKIWEEPDIRMTFLHP